MQLPQPTDALHKAWLYRVLSSLYEDAEIASALAFKGGTCASMLGWVDRFSVDLDFDFLGEGKDLKKMERRMKKIFSDLGLIVKDQSVKIPQFFLKYPAPANERSSLKLDMTFPVIKANKYEFQRFVEINRIIKCQTVETLFANKLVDLSDRYYKNKSIAGQDFYDIHHFFSMGKRYNAEVIEERTGKEVKTFLKETIEFIDQKITEKIIDEDLNSLLVYSRFKLARKFLKSETLMFLRDEIARKA